MVAGEEVEVEEGGKERLDDMYVIIFSVVTFRLEACSGWGMDYFDAGV